MIEGATRWLSYDDMAAALGITPDSARRLATRHKWPRRMGNDGRALVAVPEDRLQQAHDVGADVGTDSPADVDQDDVPDVGRDARALIGYLERRVGELTDELAAACRVEEEARAEAKEARATAEVLRVQAGQADVLTALVAAERAHLADARRSASADDGGAPRVASVEGHGAIVAWSWVTNVGYFTRGAGRHPAAPIISRFSHVNPDLARFAPSVQREVPAHPEEGEVE